MQNYVFPPSHAELLSVRGTYKKHDASDETEPNTESQSASGAEEDGGRKVRVRNVSSKGNYDRRAQRRRFPERKQAESDGSGDTIGVPVNALWRKGTEFDLPFINR